MEVEAAGQGEMQPPQRTIVEAAAVVALALMIMGVLYLAREILVPLALAILLSFALAPLVRLLRETGMPRALAVILSVVGAFATLFMVGWLMTSQVGELVRDLPSTRRRSSARSHR